MALDSMPNFCWDRQSCWSLSGIADLRAVVRQYLIAPVCGSNSGFECIDGILIPALGRRGTEGESPGERRDTTRQNQRVCPALPTLRLTD
jgi:hypothetical protein